MVSQPGLLKEENVDELLENTLGDTINITEPLTSREAEILQSIIAGKTNKQIARKLCRSERTVEYHRNRLMRKLNAKTAADLVKRAIATGIMFSSL
ncbi:MAG TPA: response regulator transcription factor [Phycisphaerales bacterium]|nr:response regulator transcription factor [Phycisphaerales bacterium]